MRDFEHCLPYESINVIGYDWTELEPRELWHCSVCKQYRHRRHLTGLRPPREVTW